MLTRKPPIRRPRAGKVPGASLIIALAAMIMLGSLISPLLPSVSANTLAQAAMIDQREADLAKAQLVPLETETETATETEVATETETSTASETATEQSRGLTVAAPATIDVNLYWCPIGTNPDTVPSGDPLKQSCTRQGPEVILTLASVGGNVVPQSTVVNQFPKLVTFGMLGVDNWTLGFATTDGIKEGLFCQGNNALGNTKPYARLAFQQSAQTGYPVDTLDGEYIICDWFGEVPATNSMSFTKWNCPEGFDFAASGYENAKQTCLELVNPPVTFEVAKPTHNPPFLKQEVTNPNANDTAFINDVPDGEVTVTEKVPAGYTLVAAYCSINNWNDPTQNKVSSDVPLTSENQFKMTIVVGSTILCDVFDVPGDPTQNGTGSTVTIYKWECPPGTMTGQTEDYYSAECATQQAGVPFDVTDDSGTQQTTSDTNGRQIDGLVGQITIKEIVPSGYGNPAIFCQLVDDPDISDYSSGNGSVTLPTGYANYQCWFYNIPDPGMGTTDAGPGDVIVYKFACASTPPADADFAWYFQNCNSEQNGATFVMDIPDPGFDIQVVSGVNGTAGLVMMGGVEAGSYPLTETVPVANYETGAVFCATIARTAQPGPGDFAPQTLNGNSITAEVAADMLLFCAWYNVPTTDDGTTVTIYKWECPEGTLYGQTEDYYSAECATQQAGIPFEVTDTVGMQPTTSDTNGRQIDGLEGEFTIKEIVPSGYGYPAIFCQLVNDVAPTDYSMGNGSVTLPPNADDDYQCWFYNIPDDGTSVTIYKWECPEGTLYGQTEDYYSAECATEQPGIPFEVTDNSGTQQTTSDTNGRQIDGLYGQITIKEIVPSGYGYPAIFCQLLNDPAPTDYSMGLGTVSLPPSLDDTYQCWFYNIPDDGTTVTIYKWECPPGTLYGQTEDYYSAECATEQPGVPFEVTDDSGTQQTTSDTNGRQIEGLYGQMTIKEMVPLGYGNPAVFCQLLNDLAPTDYSAGMGTVVLPHSYDDDYQCWFYNIPEEDSTVTVYKWECPQGMPAETTQTWFETNCTTPMNGVSFELTDSKGPRSLVTAGGMVQWTDVSTGAVQVKEMVPPGYSPSPYVVCQLTNEVVLDELPPTINGVWNTTIPHGGTQIVCHWYNWYLGPGEITVYKWTCPEGYDRQAWGADPMIDCIQATNGVTFKLDQPDPGVDLFSDTGDSINGAVYFGGLTPGDYVLSEMMAPGTMQDVFVWQCYGLNTSSVQPYPLSVGQDLSFTIAGGDKIVCHWFNVPYPQYGWMVVSKYNCTTEKYVSDVYCYTNQTGQEFNLQMWNGSSWVTVQSGKTDVSGKVNFMDLEAGDYKLVEPNTQACLMKSSNITPGGNIGVVEGQETTVYVYNCKTPPPPQTGKTPTKYPNTGVGPAAESQEQRTPGIELAGLLALAGLQINRRRMLKGAALITAGAATALPLARAQELQPLDSTPAPGTPDAAALGCEATPTAGTPAASGTPDPAATPAIDPCNRGAIPLHIRVPEIGVDAPIEYLEIIDGEMQPPSGATDVTWYKETSRLGEVGNGIYAGHLNYWGVPEGVFFRLESLQEGDIIELDGDNAETYLYQVQWMENFPSDEEPPDEALGFTDEVAITLITCGGEWISDRAEYDHRTLVRAVLWEP